MNAPASRAVYVAAGSNIDAHRHLKQALALLREQFPDLLVSGAYANAAVGFAGEDFVNLVVGFSAVLPLSELLERLHAVETACGRKPIFYTGPAFWISNLHGTNRFTIFPVWPGPSWLQAS